jgi:hypothetical protein
MLSTQCSIFPPRDNYLIKNNLLEFNRNSGTDIAISKTGNCGIHVVVYTLPIWQCESAASKANRTGTAQ